METPLIMLGITFLTQAVKKYILPKYGANGLHAFVFIVAVIVFGVQSAMTTFPSFAQYVTEVIKYLAGSIALYEVIVKKIQPSISN